MDQLYPNENNSTEELAESEVYEEELDDAEEDTEDLALDAHHRINAIVGLLVKKGIITEDELENEGALQEKEELEEVDEEGDEEEC